MTELQERFRKVRLQNDKVSGKIQEDKDSG
jgi:hypothetical protein